MLGIKEYGLKLKQNIFVLNQLISRDRKRSVSSTFMGELWEIINPLINMIVMVLVFGEMFGKGEAGSFPLYVLTGTTIYGLYTSGTTACLNALMENRNFLIKTQLNKNLYVLEKILLACRNFLLSLLIYAFVLAVYHMKPEYTWLLVIPDILLLVLMMTGIGKILAVVNVHFADITYFYKIFTLMLMYGSAIFYRIERLPDIGKQIMFINPVYVAITIAREAIMDGSCSNAVMWLIMVEYALVCYVLGSVWFRRVSQDIIAKM